MYCAGIDQPEIDWEKLNEYREHRNAIIRKCQNKRREMAKRKGLCGQCCIGKPEKGKKSCPKCLERAREYARKRRASSK